MAFGEAKCFVGVFGSGRMVMMMNLLVLLCVFFGMFDKKKRVRFGIYTSASDSDSDSDSDIASS